MAFKTVTFAAILCDNTRCPNHVEELITEDETRDWPTRLDPSFHRYLTSEGWFISRDHTVCPDHAQEVEAAAVAEMQARLDREAVEATHEPLFDLEVHV
ncbi:hypothetical protein [Nocardiopsis sp. FR26]|uniref:hypothetical protein n=1 Tax=Nocardiopsis sp. FR26 TaxID=2605987 RepID=UPI00135A0B75|nr:hypothetical protein [Nocardiopsis sp. FR26]